MPEITMPKLSDTMTEGTLVSWKKKKGDHVSAGDILAEIETDKATMEWESPEDGVLTEIYIAEGGKVNVGDKIAFIGVAGEGAAVSEKKEEPSAKKEDPEKTKSKKKELAPVAVKPRAPEKTGASSEETRIKASPVARRLAGELGLDLASLSGTGPEGRITESDVRAAGRAGRGDSLRRPSASGIKPGPGTRLNLSGMRKVIAERLVASKGPVPHFYLNIDVDAGPLMAARAELKSGGQGTDTSKISVNDFVLKAAVQAAAKIPKVNSSFDGDAIVQYADIDLAVAVAIDDGLVTPVLRAAQNKSLREISEAVKDLAHRARNKRMKPEEFQGGTFTVSNLGSYGIDSFSAIINPPQGFILAIGAIVKRPVVDHGGEIVVGHRMSICMSCDHRVIDGALGRGVS